VTSVLRRIGRLVFVLLVGVALAHTRSLRADDASRADWPVHGGDADGSRYSPLRDVTPANVTALAVAWSFDTGEGAPGLASREETKFEATPIVVDGTLYFATPLGRVFALDPDTGAQRWLYDARVGRRHDFGDFANRGVSTWLDPQAAPDAACRRRIYLATIDARLIALDAARGKPCADFGAHGTIDLRKGLRIAPFEFPAYQETSPPLAIDGLVVVGSSIADNSRLAPASGEVRAFDARTGALRWRWDPIPQSRDDPAFGRWTDDARRVTGGANVWSIMVGDPARGLIYAPTSSPAPDYYGVYRPGRNDYANSIVALRAATGEVAWHFQTVHHDLWDYDNASPPVLATLRRDGKDVAAVLQATKTGQLFVLDRTSGEPVFAVEERAVPASDVPGEAAWPTQPFTAQIEPLSPHRVSADDAWGATPEDRDACRRMMAELRNEGIHTPPSTHGTLVYPSNIGGAHWGGVAYDPVRRIAVVPVNRIAASVQLIPKPFDMDAAESESDRTGAGYEYNEMKGTPFVMRRRLLLGPSGLPCTPPPFGALVAVDLDTGKKRWEAPLGNLPAAEGGATVSERGAINLGGALITAGGLVFVGGTRDAALRAYDIENGRELWRGAIPGFGRATPMSYRARDGGRQYVVIAATPPSGHGGTLVAFALR